MYRNASQTITTRNYWKNNVVKLGIAAGIFLLASSANAQTYRGDAYGTKVNIAALVLEAGANVVDTGNLPSAGQPTPLTASLLNADIKGANNLNVLTAASKTTANGTEAAISTSTEGHTGSVTSVSTVNNLSLFPGFSINVLGVGQLTLTNSLVAANVVRSTTTAIIGSNQGTTEIAALRFGNTTFSDVNVSNAASTTYFMDILGNARVSASGVAQVGDIAKLVINGQSLSDNGATRTTEAMRLSVLPSGQVTTGDVVVASSTAGLSAAIVPEANTMSLVAMGAATLGTILVRRKTRLQSKPA